MLKLDEDKNILNIRLNETLVPLNPSYIWNIDEKPLLPDLVKGSAFSAAGIHLPPSAGNRSASWTLLFWTSAAGETIPPLIVFPEELRAQSGEIAEAILRHPEAHPPPPLKVRTGWEPHGWMNTKLFETELSQVLPVLRSRMPAHELGILIYDAHSTHVRRQAVSIAKWYGFLILTLPSHLSITLQPLDNFFNNAFAKAYQEAYQSAWVHNRQPRAADKAISVLKACQISSQKQEECRNAWSRCGMASGYPTPAKLTPARFCAGATYRGPELPQISPEYLRILFSIENLLKPPGELIRGSVLQKIHESDESTRRLSSELIQMMVQQHPSASDSPQGVSGLSMVLTTSTIGPTPYFLPRVQQTIAHTHALFLSNGSPVPQDQTQSSPEVAKAASARFAACIGGGAILSAEVMLQIMADAEHEVEQKRLEEERRTAHRNSQNPTWLSLLSMAMMQQLTAPETTLNNRKVIPLTILKSWCKKVRITQSGTQVDVANRLLRHFGLPGEVVRYEGGGGEAEGAEQAENDDHEAI